MREVDRGLHKTHVGRQKARLLAREGEPDHRRSDTSNSMAPETLER